MFHWKYLIATQVEVPARQLDIHIGSSGDNLKKKKKKKQFSSLPSTEGIPNSQAALRVLGHLGRACGPTGEINGHWFLTSCLHTTVLCRGSSVKYGPQDDD